MSPIVVCLPCTIAIGHAQCRHCVDNRTSDSGLGPLSMDRSTSEVSTDDEEIVDRKVVTMLEHSGSNQSLQSTQ